jgi:hypothetical protein
VNFLKIELEKELVNKYPNLYKEYNKSPIESCMCWGFTCGNGWFDIIANLSEKLDNLNVVAIQVKEKFGGLRFYYTFEDNVNDETREKARNLVSEAEMLSYKTCESCGKEAEVEQINGWISTLCKACRKEREKR